MQSQVSGRGKVYGGAHKRFLETLHSDGDVHKAFVICARLEVSTGIDEHTRRDKASQLVTSRLGGRWTSRCTGMVRVGRTTIYDKTCARYCGLTAVVVL